MSELFCRVVAKAKSKLFVENEQEYCVLSVSQKRRHESLQINKILIIQ